LYAVIGEPFVVDNDHSTLTEFPSISVDTPVGTAGMYAASKLKVLEYAE
jgi:hypothetical protein